MSVPSPGDTANAAEHNMYVSVVMNVQNKKPNQTKYAFTFSKNPYEMRKLWTKTETVDGQPVKKIVTINDIKVTLDGKPVSGSRKNSFLFPSIT